MTLLFYSFVLATFFFVCLQFSIFLFVESASLSIETDKEALISFRSQIRSNSSNSLSSWDQNSSPCNWTGVVCDKLGQRVIELNLSSMGLVGSISPHIGNLSFLQSLQLQNNKLQGTVPQEVSNLVRLSVLNLSFNSLEGPMPSNISKLKELKVLDMMRNNIVGRVSEELTFLSKLQVLNLGQNLLWGAVPPSVANLSALMDLNLGINSLTGTIPIDLSRLQNLKFLRLTINKLTGTSIYNMSSLVILALASNQLWGEIPTNIGETLSNLLGLHLSVNSFTGRIPGSLHNLTNVQVISITQNLLEGTVPPGLGNLPFLIRYNIAGNKIVNSREDGLGFITSLTNSTRLDSLSFDHNFLRGEIPDSVGNLSKVLTKLNMGDNQIHGSIPASIGLLKSLTLLDISNSLMIGQIPREIGQLKDLQALGLAGNKFSGGIPHSFGNLQKLTRIDLSGNQLVGDIPATLGNFQNLFSMDLSNNRLTGSIPKEILNLPSLSSVLNLSNNFLREQLPQEIGLLQRVVTIDLSNNNLSGSIPSSIGNCKSLEKLYMARNTLSGPIPRSLREVKGLETLDLSYNRISGPIPAELQQLHALKSLNLSYNDLEGAVPDDGIFRNGYEVQLEGNPKLCLHSSCKNTQTCGRRLVRLFVIIASTAALVLLCYSVSAFFYIRKRAKITGTSVLIKEQREIVSYNQIHQATRNFSEDNLLGNGSFGSVYKGYLRDDTVVAVKILDIQRSTGSWKSFLAECEALRNVRHWNLVKLITSCSSIDSKNMDFLALVYEFLRNGSLEDWLEGKRKKENGHGLNFMERLDIAIDIASAVDYLHNDCEVPVVHCHLKPSNILLDEVMTTKVGDFGLARLLLEQVGDNASISSTHILKGSIGYIPPECRLGVKPSTAVDIYSFGVMLLEIFTGKSPTDDSFIGEQNLVGWVQSAFPIDVLRVLDPELSLMDSGDSLIKILGVGLSCTVASPEGRIDIRDALYMLESIKNCLLNRNRNMCVGRRRTDP